MGLPDVGIRTAVRTGDTTAGRAQRDAQAPPHILVTTPESLYVLLGSDSGRAMLSTVRTVIVDEIHAVAGSKRGSHLALSLERLDALCGRSARCASACRPRRSRCRGRRFLVGARAVARGMPTANRRRRPRPRARPGAGTAAGAAGGGHVRTKSWERVYDRMAELVVQHRTTLIFVNTRRMAERVARHLGERLGTEHVAAHHGSLAKEYRLDAEQRLKSGELQVLVATASLELGIDIGDVDLVCQVGSPRNIAAFLQRVGRSGHQVGGMPKGRLFPTSRDDLVECAALLDCVRRGELDALRIPRAPLDVLAQQIVAEVACARMGRGRAVRLVRRAQPYAQLERERLRRRPAHAGRRLHHAPRRARRLPAPRRRAHSRCAGGAAAS